MRVCPRCRLTNPGDAGVCDCGFNFRSKKSGSEAGATIDTEPALASVADRLGALMVDGVLGAAIFLWFILLASFIHSAAGVLVVSGSMLAVAFVLLIDALRGGQGTGKRVLHVRVVDARTLQPCTLTQAVTRRAFLLLGPIDWVCVLGNRRQRLGDQVAGTQVIAGR